MDHDNKVIEFLEKVPVMYYTTMESALTGKPSRAKAIKAMCLSCSAFVREEITNCRVILCPLYAYRPYQSPAAPTERT
jgi:hypothetical protein